MIESAKKFVTPEEYLLREAQAEYKSEFRDGEIFAMNGASLNHNQIIFNTAKVLDRLLERKPCRVFSSDVRLYIDKRRLYTYPDVMVVCGKIELVPGRDDTLTNPRVIVEVWSDPTQEYDRGKKFAMYRDIPSLQDYVMIDQTRPYIEYFRRDQQFWVLETLEGTDAVLTLHALECEIALSAIYEKVEWLGEAASQDKN
ncbi:MAG: Uma2 family endonuclease [Chloroflexota bacterium]